MSLVDISVLNWLLALFGVVSTGVGAWLYFRPGVQRGKAAIDAILGEPEIKDRRGAVMDPGKPGLVHRVASVEEAVVQFSHLVGIVTEALGRMDAIDSRVKALEDSNVRDIVVAAERAANATVSAEMLRLANERDTIPGHADEPSGEL